MANKCIGCQVQDGSFKINGGFIHESKNFNVIQDWKIPIPGFMVIQSKRHITSVGEFTEEEHKEYSTFLFEVRKAMRDVLSIKNVYLIQEEDSVHFHMWLLPMCNWMEKGIANARKNCSYARDNMNTEENMKEVNEYIQKLKNHFNG
ncbi:MAG: diadenosine tetraphosphate hydrolase [Candidatus Delongbacteria bacterium]|jgi:diadenosine tetraphosphate (Ap4A) HIT family hydrolase|nr:diadenosine tetraphosphate hydrolase [Candidatus Delongbacteria bacterium]